MEDIATGYCGIAKKINGFRNRLVKSRDALGVKQWSRCILQFGKSLTSWFLEARRECQGRLILVTCFCTLSLNLVAVVLRACSRSSYRVRTEMKLLPDLILVFAVKV